MTALAETSDSLAKRRTRVDGSDDDSGLKKGCLRAKACLLYLVSSMIIFYLGEAKVGASADAMAHAREEVAQLKACVPAPRRMLGRVS